MNIKFLDEIKAILLLIKIAYLICDIIECQQLRYYFNFLVSFFLMGNVS